MQLQAVSRGQRHSLTVTGTGVATRVTLDGQPFAVDVFPAGPALYSLLIGGQAYEVDCLPAPDGYLVLVNGQPFQVALGPAEGADPAPPAAAPPAGGAVLAPMSGKVLRVLVALGEPVAAGAPLLVLEAMKMENEVRAPRPGRVAALPAAAGATVRGGEVLVVLE